MTHPSTVVRAGFSNGYHSSLFLERTNPGHLSDHSRLKVSRFNVATPLTLTKVNLLT